MKPTAKQLIEAATPSSVLIVAAKDLENRARDGGSQSTMTSDLWLARHSLATVRPDDDEPVTELACRECIGTPRINDWGDAVWMFGVRGPSLSIGCMCGTVTLTWGRHPIDLPDDLTMGRLRDILRGFGLKSER